MSYSYCVYTCGEVGGAPQLRAACHTACWSYSPLIDEGGSGPSSGACSLARLSNCIVTFGSKKMVHRPRGDTAVSPSHCRSCAAHSCRHGAVKLPPSAWSVPTKWSRRSVSLSSWLVNLRYVSTGSQKGRSTVDPVGGGQRSGGHLGGLAWLGAVCVHIDDQTIRSGDPFE